MSLGDPRDPLRDRHPDGGTDPAMAGMHRASARRHLDYVTTLLRTHEGRFINFVFVSLLNV